MDKRKAVIASLGKQSDFQDSLTVYVRGKSVEREETVKGIINVSTKLAMLLITLI